MKKILIILTVLAFVGCKDDKKSEDGQAQPQQEQPAGNEFFRATLDVVAKKDDSFHLFYSEDGNFTEENSIWVEFKGSENSQKLNFDVPKDKLPSQIRIDFGLNKDQGDIKVNGLELSYYGKNVTITGADFFNYFRPNETNTQVDPQTQTLKAKDPNGNPFSGPSMYPLEASIKAIEQITR
ncbi:hypothetical protein [Flavobacterium sp.]|uniref:hypothetical protein n=1 Tax=Flavobacterium sp. TaxID=239 RepID=UPI0039E31970